MDFTGERFVPLPSLLQDEIGFEHLHRYHTVKNITNDKIVLDIACGEGYGAAIIAQHAQKVYGVDIDEQSITHAKNVYGSALTNVEFMQGEATKIPLADDSVDVIISFETIEHLKETAQQLFMKEIKRILRSDGILIMSTPDTKNYSERYEHKNEYHEKEFTKNEFSVFLQRYFHQVNIFTQGYEIISAITKEQLQDVKQVSICEWDRESAKPFSRKYLIAACSNIAANADLSSIVFQVSADYLQMTDRIVEKEKHILELGNWGKGLDFEIAGKNSYIQQLQGEAEQFKNTIERYTREGELKDSLLQMQRSLQHQLTEINSRLTRNEENEKAILVLNDTLNQKEAALTELKSALVIEINKLREVEEKLEATESAMKEQAIANNEKLNLLEVSKKALDTEITFLNEFNEKQTVLLNNKTDQLEKETRSGEDQKTLFKEQEKTMSNLQRRLQIAEDRLQLIFNSEGWKLLKRYYNFKGRVLPENSKRYNFLKKTYNKIRGKREVLDTRVPAYQAISKEISVAAESEALVTTYDVIEFTPYHSPLVSIIIPVYNAWDMTYKCLSSIKQTVTGIPYEIIVGDDASTDQVRDIAQYVKNIVLVRNEKNVGFLTNSNNAAAVSKGKYIVFLNNDTTVKPDWLSSLIELMESNDNIGMTGSKLIYPDGRLQEAGGIIWKDASGWNFGHSQDPEAPQFNYVKEVDYVSGASIMIRADLWKKLGGFDKQYIPAYYEDTDLAFAVRDLGYKVMFQPLSQVIHHEGYSHGEQSKEYQLLNNKKFLEKWKKTLNTDHFKNAENVYWARDRSRYKKTILVIDHYVPHFDKDAGSRAIFKVLKLLTELDYNVKFIGDNFYRHEPYTTILQQMGIEVLFGNWYAENWPQWIKDNAKMIDFVLLSRPHISVKYIDFIKSNTSASIIYYGHDLHFLREKRQYEIEKTPGLLNSMKEWKQLETSLIQKSDTVLTLSCVEKEIMETELSARNVRVLPVFFYDTFNHPITDFSNRKDLLFIGGFNHKPNVDAVKWFVEEIWPLVIAALTDIRFIIVGSHVPQQISDLHSETIFVKGQVTDKELNDLYNSIKLVVVPLRFGAGMKGKSVEAMHQGIPLVSTSLGVEGFENVNDILQTQDEATSFAENIISLYNDEQRLKDLSQKETTYATTHFSKKVVQEVITDIFRK